MLIPVADVVLSVGLLALLFNRLRWRTQIAILIGLLALGLTFHMIGAHLVIERELIPPRN